MKTIKILVSIFFFSNVIAADLDDVSTAYLGAGSVMTLQEFVDVSGSELKRKLLQGHSSLNESVLAPTVKQEELDQVSSLFKALSQAKNLQLSGGLLGKWAIMKNLNERCGNFSVFISQYLEKRSNSHADFKQWVDDVANEKGGDVALIFLYLSVRSMHLNGVVHGENLSYLKSVAQKAEKSLLSE